MKGLLIDASIAGAWFLTDEKNEAADWVLRQMQGGVPTFVPNLWLLEMANLLFNAERRKRLDRNRRDAALESLERMALNVLPGPSLHDLRSIRIYAEKHQLTPYDAEYLRVAREQGLMLASLDRNLLSAARREKLRVVGSS